MFFHHQSGQARICFSYGYGDGTWLCLYAMGRGRLPYAVNPVHNGVRLNLPDQLPCTPGKFGSLYFYQLMHTGKMK